MIYFLLGLFISSTIFEMIFIIILYKKYNKNVVSDFNTLKNIDPNVGIEKSDFFV